VSNLSEFLKKQATELRTSERDARSVLDDWIGSVSELLQKMETWLREADSEKILRIEHVEHRMRERVIGSYGVKGLVVRMGDNEVRIAPVARYSIGSFVGDSLGESIRNGRVDMTNGQNRFMLYRKSGSVGEWLIVDDQNYQARPLDKENFESAIQSLLT
jgi:hypothetical protein